jgi:Lytic transglycolase
LIQLGPTFSGQGTFFSPGLGACGITNSDSDLIVAIGESLFDSGNPGNPNNDVFCGHKIKATVAGGASVTVTVTDRCVACGPDDLDFSPAAFDQLADPSAGRIDITWQWVS